MLVQLHYIVFTKLPGDIKYRTFSAFESSCHLPTCLPHTVKACYCPFNPERQAGILQIVIFMVCGLIRPGIEPGFTVSVEDDPL